VTADYQDMLEKAWIFDLRRRYPFTVNKEVLKTVNKHQ
jgi:peptidyl-prolyl cis-trans isomerase SurA